MPLLHVPTHQGWERIIVMYMAMSLVMFSLSHAFVSDEGYTEVPNAGASNVDIAVQDSLAANKEDAIHHHVVSSDINLEADKFDESKISRSEKLGGTIQSQEALREEFLAKIEIEKDQLRSKKISIDQAKEVFERMAKLRYDYQMVEPTPEAPTAAERLDSLIDGFVGQQLEAFNECVVSYEDASKDNTELEDIIDAMGEDCTNGLKGIRASPAAHCSQGKEHLKLLTKLLPEAVTSSGERLCAVILDEIVPFDEEPECVQVIGLITTSFAQRTNKTVPWPGIINRPQFQAAFREACHIQGREQGWCNGRLNEVLDLTTENKTLEEFFVDFCETVATPLKGSDARIEVHEHTTRGRFLSLFKRSALLAEERRGKSGTDLIHKGVQSDSRTKKNQAWDECCYDDDCDDFLHCNNGFEDCRRNNGQASPCPCNGEGRCKPNSDHVCTTKKARTIEKSVGADLVIVDVGYTETEGWGYVEEDQEYCYVAKAKFDSICGSVPIVPSLPDASYGIVLGKYKEFSNIAGNSWAISVGLCFLFCVEGGVIQDENGNQIGTFVGLEASFGFNVGVEFGKAFCHTIGPGSVDDADVELVEVQIAELCISSHMTVKLESGDDAFLDELKVGNMVQTMKDNGDVQFEPFLGFYHVHRTKLAEFLKVVHGGAAGRVLEVTERHLVYVMRPDGLLDTIAAGDLEPGMILVMPNDEDDGNRFVESRIDYIGTVMREGVYSPFTYSSKLVVGSVLVSSYTVLPGLKKGKYYMATADAFTFLFRMRRWILVSLGFTWEDHEQEVLFFMKCWPPFYKIWMFMSKTLPKSISSLRETTVYMLQHAS